MISTVICIHCRKKMWRWHPHDGCLSSAVDSLRPNAEVPRRPTPSVSTLPILSISELMLFRKLIKLKDLPDKKDGGRAPLEWSQAVTLAEQKGLLHTPGSGPFWTLTDKGRQVINESSQK